MFLMRGIAQVRKWALVLPTDYYSFKQPIGSRLGSAYCHCIQLCLRNLADGPLDLVGSRYWGLSTRSLFCQSQSNFSILGMTSPISNGCYVVSRCYDQYLAMPEDGQVYVNCNMNAARVRRLPDWPLSTVDSVS